MPGDRGEWEVWRAVVDTPRAGAGKSDEPEPSAGIGVGETIFCVRPYRGSIGRRLSVLKEDPRDDADLARGFHVDCCCLSGRHCERDGRDWVAVALGQRVVSNGHVEHVAAAVHAAGRGSEVEVAIAGNGLTLEADPDIDVACIAVDGPDVDCLSGHRREWKSGQAVVNAAGAGSGEGDHSEASGIVGIGEAVFLSGSHRGRVRRRLAVEKERAGNDAYVPARLHIDHRCLARGDGERDRRDRIAVAFGECVVADGDVERVAAAVE